MKTVLIVVILFLFGLLCGFLGACIDRSVAADPSDPRVRHRIMQKWNAKMENFKRDEQEYRRQEGEWKQKIKSLEEELERAQRERELARLYWVEIRGEKHCVSSGHKNYTAKLANLRKSMDGVEACRATPITLNGVTYNIPVTCEDTGTGFWGGVFGSWVTENEPTCDTYWEDVNVKGCTAPNSGFRRVETKFGSVHSGEDVEALCLSTPLIMHGWRYERPVACPYVSIFTGYWGMWNIPDDTCN